MVLFLDNPYLLLFIFGLTGINDVGCLWPLVCGLWSLVCGLWSLVCGLWLLVYGLWSLVYGLWPLVYGLWQLVWGLWTLICGLCDKVALWLLYIQQESCHMTCRCLEVTPSHGFWLLLDDRFCHSCLDVKSYTTLTYFTSKHCSEAQTHDRPASQQHHL